jgi:hypothetical protein
MKTEWASENLQVIRTLMERAAVYRRALAPVMGLVGATGIAAGVASVFLNFQSSRLFSVYWAATALVCLVEAFLLIRRQAVRSKELFWTPPTRRVAQAVLPAFFTGLVLGVVFFIVDTPRWDGVIVLGVTWLVLYGLALHAAGFFMQRGFRLFGWGYVLAGLAVLGCWIYYAMTPHSQPPVPSTGFVFLNAGMGVLFGGGHAAYGIYLAFTEKPEPAA